ncbi:MAG TPA: hypothetical protein VJS68_02870 [Thermoplasmata archaeon]|nr:hypothetical protein [Thermoplasmata archaeon]
MLSLALVVLIVASFSGSLSGHSSVVTGTNARPDAAALRVVTFSYSPSTVTSGTTIQGTIDLAGGVAPYYAWLNNTPAGCQPPTTPYLTNNLSNTFNCSPSTTGTFNVHLDIVDSSAPVMRASSTTTLTVNSNSSGTGNGNGNNSGNPFSFPSGLLTLVTIFGAIFLGSLVALAAGVIATAVMVSRRLRQLTEAMKLQSAPPTGDKPSAK